MLERRHAREADAVLDLPVCLTGLVIGNADNITRPVLLPQLGGGGVHRFGVRTLMIWQAVAAGAT